MTRKRFKKIVAAVRKTLPHGHTTVLKNSTNSGTIRSVSYMPVTGTKRTRTGSGESDLEEGEIRDENTGPSKGNQCADESSDTSADVILPYSQKRRLVVPIDPPTDPRLEDTVTTMEKATLRPSPIDRCSIPVERREEMCSAAASGTGAAVRRLMMAEEGPSVNVNQDLGDLLRHVQRAAPCYRTFARGVAPLVAYSLKFGPHLRNSTAHVRRFGKAARPFDDDFEIVSRLSTFAGVVHSVACDHDFQRQLTLEEGRRVDREFCSALLYMSTCTRDRFCGCGEFGRVCRSLVPPAASTPAKLEAVECYLLPRVPWFLLFEFQVTLVPFLDKQLRTVLRHRYGVYDIKAGLRQALAAIRAKEDADVIRMRRLLHLYGGTTAAQLADIVDEFELQAACARRYDTVAAPWALHFLGGFLELLSATRPPQAAMIPLWTRWEQLVNAVVESFKVCVDDVPADISSEDGNADDTETQAPSTAGSSVTSVVPDGSLAENDETTALASATTAERATQPRVLTGSTTDGNSQATDLVGPGDNRTHTTVNYQTTTMRTASSPLAPAVLDVRSHMESAAPDGQSFTSTASATATASSEPAAKLKKFLADAGLSQYLAPLQAAGAEEIEDLTLLTDEDYRKLGVLLVHIRRLQLKLRAREDAG